MSNPFLDKAKASRATKMEHEGVKGEDPRAKAHRIAKYADGGEVSATPLPASPFNEVKGPRKPRGIPSGPTVPPINKP